jgi:hypothetical protein
MPRIAAITLLVLIANAAAKADALVLIDGRTVDGKVTLEKDAVVATPAKGEAVRAAVGDVLSLSLDRPATKPPARRVTLLNGTTLAATEILSVSETEIRFKRDDGSFTTLNAAFVHSIDYAPGQPATPPSADFVGVIPASGDASEGQILSGDEKVLRTSSVLFGLQEFPADQLRKVYFRPMGLSAAAFEVTTADGSVYQAQSLKTDRGKLAVTTDLLGVVELPESQLRSVALGPAAAKSLAEAAGQGEVVVRAGEERTITLAGGYRAAVLTLDVPSRQVPTREVTITVSAGGKALAKAGPMTSLDAPRTVTVPFDGASEITVSVTATGPAELGAAGRVASGRFVLTR